MTKPEGRPGSDAEIAKYFGLTDDESRDIQRFAMIAVAFEGDAKRKDSYDAMISTLKSLKIDMKDKGLMRAFLAGYSLHSMIGRTERLGLIKTGGK